MDSSASIYATATLLLTPPPPMRIEDLIAPELDTQSTDPLLTRNHQNRAE